MFKEKMKRLSRFLLENSKLILPVVIILAVAITVWCALRAKDIRNQEEAALGTASGQNTAVAETAEAPAQIPLTENTDADMQKLIDDYYAAYAQGDIDAIRTLTNHLEETDALMISAKSEYVEDYLDKVIYTRPGPKPDTYLVYVYFKMKFINFDETVSGMEPFYVCKRADGSLYFNEGELSDEELEYIEKTDSQEDVEELRNRVEVECKETLTGNEELFLYIQEVLKEVQKSTGEAIAQQQNGETQEPETVTEPEEGNGTEVSEPVPEDTGNAAEPIYAKATTTVNVRASDSEQADKVDKITAGTKVEVLEQKVNGWSKVKIGKTEGYIKSEFLQLMNAAANEAVMGTVTATSNVNVRMSASETADRLGVLVGGETVDLLGRENGWCKINYNGQIGYVKEDFVQ